MKLGNDKDYRKSIFILCGTLTFFEQLCVIAISQRFTKKTLSFTEKD